MSIIPTPRTRTIEAMNEMAPISDKIGGIFKEAVERYGHEKARLLVSMAVSDYILGTVCEDHLMSELRAIDFIVEKLIHYVTQGTE